MFMRVGSLADSALTQIALGYDLGCQCLQIFGGESQLRQLSGGERILQNAGDATTIHQGRDTQHAILDPVLALQQDPHRQNGPLIEQDRLLAPDIEAMRRWARRGQWPQALHALLPSSCQ